MLLDLIDALRCVHAHQDGWLVATADAIAGRRLLRGTLGCPICHAEYPVRRGVAWFDPARADARWPDAAPPAGDAEERHAEALRLGALLGLDAPGGTVVLGGGWDALAEPLLALVETRVLLAEPERLPPLRDELAPVAGAPVIPLAAGAARGVALDARTAADVRVASAVRALRGGGRLVAPADVPIPEGVRELARDERHWVGERVGGSGSLLTLRRA